MSTPDSSSNHHRSDFGQALVRYRRLIVLGLHLILIPLGYGVAFLLRFDAAVPPQYVDLFVWTLPILLILRLVSFDLFGLYKGLWRHVGMYDVQALVKAVTLSSVGFVAALLALGQFGRFPGSIILLDWGIAICTFGGGRFAARWLRESGVGRGLGLEGKRTLIVGAGDAAANLLRQLKNGAEEAIHAVGLVDDDPNKRWVQLDGVPVLGCTGDIPALVNEHHIQLVILAIASASGEETRRIARQCRGLGVELKIVPTLHELLDGRARLDQLRTVEPEELLGRTPVTLDLARVRGDLRGAVVLVTGGAGSIGSELARQIAHFGPARLVLLEQAETPLYFVEIELRRQHPELELVPIVGDVTDEVGLENVFSRYRPDYVFHAAAYKHVPMMESNVTEAVRNNTLGTMAVAEAAARYGVGRFVLISTDKAVRPSSIMGASKRIAERAILGNPSLRNGRTDFRAVRFGNVLGSAGSVIPLFRRQIRAGGPVTVTDPEVTRYFMTIPEAVQLVLQAASLPEAAGRISMLDMGKPVKILEMAENLVRLSGLEPYEEMPIIITGMRPGEKLHEELTLEIEESMPTKVQKIRVLQSVETDGAAVGMALDQLVAAVVARDDDRVLDAVCSLLPDAVPPLSDRGRAARARRAIRPGWLTPRVTAIPVAARQSARAGATRVGVEGDA